MNDQTIDYAECADCGNRDFQSTRFFEQQLADAPTILLGLSSELAALFSETKPLDITAEQATAELYL